MDTLLVVLEGIVVLAAIFFGVRTGGIGLGLWGLVGVAVLVFVFRLTPGAPPIDAMLIILTVVTSAAAMQAAGGVDHLVNVASTLIQRNPAGITFVAPFVAFLFTLGAGTGNIYYPLIPVIYQVAYQNRIRPERPLAVSAVASQLAITASRILAVVVPASLIGLLVAALVELRLGAPLEDDPVFKARVESGQIKPPDPALLALKELKPGAATSAYIFLVAVAAIVLLGVFTQLRPMIPNGNGGFAPLSTTFVIELIMGIAGVAIIGILHVKPAEVVRTSTMTAALTTSQSSATRAILPIGLALHIPTALLVGMWTSVIGIYFFPANGSQLATVGIDETGTTRIGGFVINHSFQLPTIICWVVSAVVGSAIALALFGRS
jgi:anaerobic C4-dicarboxylate transporter DcuB